MVRFSTLLNLLACRFSLETDSQMEHLSSRDETLSSKSRVRRFIAIKVGILAEVEQTF